MGICFCRQHFYKTKLFHFKGIFSFIIFLRYYNFCIAKQKMRLLQLLALNQSQINSYWVDPSKREGMDGAFRGLAGLLRGISRGQSLREIPRSSHASPWKTPSSRTLLLGFTFYLK